MQPEITTRSMRQFINEVADQHHAMAGATISATAAEAVALGIACLQISGRLLGDQLNSDELSGRLEQVQSIKSSLVRWCDQDANAIAEFVALREAGQELKGQQMLCTAPAEICSLAIAAAEALQSFRPLVAERVHDDLEMSISLLAGIAQAAMLLLDSNLRIWPEPALLEQFEPIRAKLERQIGALKPVARLRGNKDATP
jgi:formiminotetrahydrofolate cyclodeaminase